MGALAFVERGTYLPKNKVFGTLTWGLYSRHRFPYKGGGILLDRKSPLHPKKVIVINKARGRTDKLAGDHNNFEFFRKSEGPPST